MPVERTLRRKGLSPKSLSFRSNHFASAITACQERISKGTKVLCDRAGTIGLWRQFAAKAKAEKCILPDIAEENRSTHTIHLDLRA